MTSRIFTSRYQNPAIASSGLVPIGITLGNPRFRLGYALAANLRQLAPTRAMFHLTDRADFEPLYRARLDELGLEPITQLLAEHDRGAGVALLCFENVRSPDGTWCHRQCFADWYSERTGEQVSELDDPSPPPRLKAARSETSNVQQIGLSDLHPNPANPRTFFSVDALNELATSIKQHGLLQPLVVRPRAAGGYELIAGERRLRAAHLAGIQTLPCMVLRSVTDADAFILSVTENVARRDMSIVEEAKAYARIQALGKSVAEIAALFGKGEPTIQYRLDLLSLRDDVQHLVARGQLGAGPAWYLCRLSHAGQADVLKKILAGQLPTDEQIQRYAAAVRMREESPEMFFGPPVDELVEATRRVHRSKIQTAWSRVEQVGPSMAMFLELSPQEVALAIGADVSLYHERIELLTKTIRRTGSLLRQALALREAAALDPVLEA